MSKQTLNLQETVLKGYSLRSAKKRYMFASDCMDGVLWSPRHRLAMVTDGIGGLQIADEEWGGDGMLDVEIFESHLRGVRELTRERVREIFFSMAGESRESVSALMYFMPFLHEKALLLQAGDCSVVRINRLSHEKSLEVIAPPQNVWEEGFRDVVFPPDLNRVTSINDLKKYDIPALKTIISAMVEHIKTRPKPELYQRRLNHSLFWVNHSNDAKRYREVLFQIIQMLRSRMTCSWRAADSHIRSKIGDGQLVEVRKGDRFALCTDGIFPGVVTENEMEESLMQDQIHTAAKRIMKYAKMPNRKEDDRGIVIVDVDAKPYRKK